MMACVQGLYGERFTMRGRKDLQGRVNMLSTRGDRLNSAVWLG